MPFQSKPYLRLANAAAAIVLAISISACQSATPTPKPSGFPTTVPAPVVGTPPSRMQVAPVQGTPMDFTKPQAIGSRIDQVEASTHQARAAPGIFCKQIPHVHSLDRLVMLTKGVPGSALREWNCTARHRVTSLAFQRFFMCFLLPDRIAIPRA